MKKITFGTWYCEFHDGIRICDFFNIMIFNLPILVLRKYDDPHAENQWKTFSLGIFGFSINF